MWIGHRKEIQKLTFRALALRWIRSDEGSKRQLGFINPVDKTKLSCNTPTDAAPQFL